MTETWSDLVATPARRGAPLRPGRVPIASPGRRPAARRHRPSPAATQAWIVAGEPTPTNELLADAFAHRGLACSIALPARVEVRPGDVVLARLDVSPSLDGIEPGLWLLPRLDRRGATVLNPAHALLAAHDKLSTALRLARAGIPHPRTAHAWEVRVPARLRPPFVVKPRFGSWGRDIFRCDSPEALLACLETVRRRSWFRRHGAVVQELVRSHGRDLRIVVAAGRVVGAIERVARPGEWRTNVALGAVRRQVVPPLEARHAALRAAAAIGIDLAGIDLVLDGSGRYVVLELNGAVDFTPDYAYDGGDVFGSGVDALLAAARIGTPRVLESRSTVALGRRVDRALEPVQEAQRGA